MPPTISRPGPDEERPRPAILAAAAVAGILGGLLLVRCSMEPRPAADEPGTSEPAPPGADADTREGAQDARPAVAAEAGTGGGGEPPDAGGRAEDGGRDSGPRTQSDETGGDEAAPTAGTAADTPPAARVARIERLAYLRCQGVERPGTATGCQRDRDLERAAWAVVRGLPSCPTAPPGLGEADLRLHFAQGQPTEVMLREDAPSGAERLDGPLVLACLREPLSGLSTTLPTADLILSIRFRLTPPE